MRIFICALLLAGACATTNTGANHPTNVAHVRLAIASAMQTQSPERTIASMGKTTDDRAIVYTTSKTGAHQEETWVRDSSGWKLDHAVATDGAANVEAAPASSSL
jgi:hypothetical protein